MSKGKKASSEKMARLHNKLTDVLLEMLDGDVVIDPETGEEVKYQPSPQVLNVARALLKDNEMVVDYEATGQDKEFHSKLAKLRKDMKAEHGENTRILQDEYSVNTSKQ